MAGEGKELNAQLFIEGRHVPFTSATTNYQAGQPCSMTINMVPIREIKQVLPRTMVHLFVKDQSYKGTYKPWVLLFEGEIYGYGGRKSGGGRSITLMCMGLSNYWDNAKQYYVNLKTSHGSMLASLQTQNNIKETKRDGMQVVSNFASPEAFLTRTVHNALKANKDFIEAVIEIVDSLKEINSFFRYSDARYRITDRIVFQTSGNIKELYNFENNSGIIDQITSRGSGGIVTVRQIINQLMSLIFHDFSSVPAPSKVETAAFKKSKKGIGPNRTKTIGSFVFKPNTFILPPPKCNVLFPDMYDSLSFGRNFFHEVTRFKLQPNLPGLQVNSQGEAQVFRDTVYAPEGFEKFSTGIATTEDEGKQKMFSGEGQGKKNDDTSESKVAPKLQEFNFLSYEEILKGIFPEMGGTIPSATIFTKTSDYEVNYNYYKRVADFMFHKKRLASRSASISGPLNLAPVPGFTMLALDNSEAEQHVVGVLQQISHNISATQGGYTQYQLSFVRDVEERDLWSGESYEPPIPGFYDKEVFGERRAVKNTDYNKLPKYQQSRVKELGEINDFGNSKLNTYYQGLLGEVKSNSHLGAAPITSQRHPTLVGATLDLMNQYRAAKNTDRLVRFIDTTTRRDYVGIEECYQFLGANVSKFKKRGNTSPTFYATLENLVFSGGTFDGSFVDNVDSANSRDKALAAVFKKAISKRREPINAYRLKLKKERGFRG